MNCDFADEWFLLTADPAHAWPLGEGIGEQQHHTLRLTGHFGGRVRVWILLTALWHGY